MSKLYSALLAVGLSFTAAHALAQNDEAQTQTQTDSLSSYNEMGVRQTGIEQYNSERGQCAGMSGEQQDSCLHDATVRYQSWAIVQCQLITGKDRQKCYSNIQAAVKSPYSQSGEAGPPVRSGVPSGSNSQTGDADKPEQQ